MAQLVGKDLTLGYEGKPVISGLNFSVNAGDYVCIVGENGSGKTTLMKTILGLQPPISGTVKTGDGLSFHEIGYLPQQTAVQRDFPASVREIVLSGCLGRCRGPMIPKTEKQRAGRCMEKMGLSGLEKQCFRELSGGQQQRVLLARALCAAEKMLLLDEPVTGLDEKTKKGLYSLIEELNREGITVIMITHDAGAAENAGHILYMGDRYFFGAKDAFFAGDAGKEYRERGKNNDV